MSASVVKLTAANADVTSLTIGGARLALTVIAADIWRAATEIRIAFTTQRFAFLSLAVSNAENKRLNGKLGQHNFYYYNNS